MTFCVYSWLMVFSLLGLFLSMAMVLETIRSFCFRKRSSFSICSLRSFMIRLSVWYFILKRFITKTTNLQKIFNKIFVWHKKKDKLNYGKMTLVINDGRGLMRRITRTCTVNRAMQLSLSHLSWYSLPKLNKPFEYSI